MKKENSERDGQDNLLEKMRRENPFTVPHGYFDRLPETVIRRCVRAEKKYKWMPEYLFLRPGLAFMLAFVSCCLFVTYIYFRQQPDKGFTSLKIPESYDFLRDIDESLIIEVLERDHLQGGQSEIEEYLIENRVDILQITEDENL
jgi:hypothetical protein